jgi:cbb3-type cytochrome oxidase subunit 1
MINIHFIATVLAVVIIYASLLIAGLRQADALQNVNADFANVVKSTSSVLLLRTAGYGLFVIGQLAFLVNVLLTMVRLPSRAGEEPLLAEPPAMEVVS